MIENAYLIQAIKDATNQWKYVWYLGQPTSCVYNCNGTFTGKRCHHNTCNGCTSQHAANKKTTALCCWKCIRDHPFSTYAKFSEKLTFVTHWYVLWQKEIGEVLAQIFLSIFPRTKTTMYKNRQRRSEIRLLIIFMDPGLFHDSGMYYCEQNRNYIGG